MPKVLRGLLLVLLAFVVLFAVGMLTRFPAMRIGGNYGLHAVFAAFFYAVIVAVFQIKTSHVYPVVVGAVGCGVVLGMMSPVMAVAQILPAIAYLLVFIVGRLRAAETADKNLLAIVGAVVYAACAYVGTIVGGALFSGCVPSIADLPFLLLSIGLGLLGALAGTAIAHKLTRRVPR